VSLDLAKYRRIFLEEATDHLAEMGRALLDLEKELGSAAAIDTIFRMAHSIKSMAASLGYDPIAELAHRMEDRMEGVRAEGRVRGPDELSVLFRALETLEAMVSAVAREESPAPVASELLEVLGGRHDSPGSPGSEALPDPSERVSLVGGDPKKVPT
jgi:two-component system chemotaxis sensor kinase CheA